MSHKKPVIASVVVLILFIIGYFVTPLILPLFIDKRVDEAPLIDISLSDTQNVGQIATTSDNTIISTAKGSFVGFDRIHTGTGTVQVIMQKDSHIVRFESDFSVQNGPDLYVGFGKDGKYVEGSEIAVLKGNIGSQNYVVNKNFDPETYNEVWIWCKQFSEPFARAVLQM